MEAKSENYFVFSPKLLQKTEEEWNERHFELSQRRKGSIHSDRKRARL